MYQALSLMKNTKNPASPRNKVTDIPGRDNDRDF